MTNKNGKTPSEAFTEPPSDYLPGDNRIDDGEHQIVSLTEKVETGPVAVTGVIPQTILWKALFVLRFAILADAINSQILGPNYGLLVLEDGHTDSFESTKPFDFGGAYYIIPATNDFGMFLSSLLFGYWSDYAWCGRKGAILACTYLGAAGSILKYFCRENFWTFLGANFLTGLVGGSVAVALAFVSDLSKSRLETDAEIGIIIAISMIGRTGGGVMAIALQSYGLFTPLWVAAATNIVAGVLCHIWMVEPKKFITACNHVTGTDLDDTKRTQLDSSNSSSDEDHVVSSSDPTMLDRKALLRIIVGELFDNFGSIGLVPLCLSPLLFRVFYADFVENGLEPIMSATSYKWIYIFVAVIVLPGAALSPFLFQKFGPARCCVLANIFTGIVIVALLQIATNVGDNPTFATFCIFVTVLYVAFPFTVMSQLSTGPMMDRITPISRRGEVQGFNMAVMNFSSAFGPFLYALLYDYTNIQVTLYSAVGISFVAALINFGLTKDRRFGPELTGGNAETDDKGAVTRSMPLDFSEEIEC